MDVARDEGAAEYMREWLLFVTGLVAVLVYVALAASTDLALWKILPLMMYSGAVSGYLLRHRWRS